MPASLPDRATPTAASCVRRGARGVGRSAACWAAGPPLCVTTSWGALAPSVLLKMALLVPSMVSPKLTTPLPLTGRRAEGDLVVRVERRDGRRAELRACPSAGLLFQVMVPSRSRAGSCRRPGRRARCWGWRRSRTERSLTAGDRPGQPGDRELEVRPVGVAGRVLAQPDGRDRCRSWWPAERRADLGVVGRREGQRAATAGRRRWCWHGRVAEVRGDVAGDVLDRGWRRACRTA